MVVEDDAPTARALSAFLAGHDATCAIAPALGAAKTQCETERFDAAIIDLGLPDGPGHEVIALLRDGPHPTASVVVSAGAEPDQVRGGLRAGAIDYVLKPWQAGVLVRALERALLDTRALRAALARVFAPDAGSTPPVEALDMLASGTALSPRQAQVLSLILQGLSDDEIAEEIQVAAPTAKHHVQAVFRKLGVHSRPSLLTKLVPMWVARRRH